MAGSTYPNSAYGDDAALRDLLRNSRQYNAPPAFSMAGGLLSTVARILRDAGLLSMEGMILPAILSARLIEALGRQAPMSYQIYPALVSDLSK